MDEFEKKIRENYQAMKREDEKATPGFDAIMGRPRQLKHSAKLYPNTALKIAASVIGVALMLSFYFYAHFNHSKQTIDARSTSLRPYMPSDSILKVKLGNEYIWHWKSSTDHLVEDARQITKTRTQTNKVI